MDDKYIKTRKKINAKQAFNKNFNYLYDLGNSNRIARHKILNVIYFEKIVIFKIENRGVFFFKENESFDISEKMFCDPRIIDDIRQKHLYNELDKINEKIGYYNELKKQTIIFLDNKKIVDNNIELIDNFLNEYLFQIKTKGYEV